MAENTEFVKCKEKSFTGDTEPDFERNHTRSSIYLIHKWFFEGMPPKLIGSILNRSEENVLKALRYPLYKNELYVMRSCFSRFTERENNFLSDSCTEQQKRRI